MIALALCSLALPTVPQERRGVPLTEAQTRAPSASALRLELYYVSRIVGLADLERAVEEHEANAPARVAGDDVLAFEALQRRRKQFEWQRNGLLGALRASMRPPAGEDTRIEWLPGGRVAVLAEPEQHVWAREVLARTLAFDGMIEVTAVLWSLPAGPAASALVGRNRERLGKAEAEDLTGRLEALGAELVNAPRVLSRAFSPVELRAGEALPYVADWEFLELADREGTVSSPVVKTAFDGFEMRSTCYPTPNGRLQVEVDFTHRRLVRPIPSLETTFGGRSTPVVVQLPEWSSVEIQGRIELAPDETLLLTAEDHALDRVVLALLRARTVEEQDER